MGESLVPPYTRGSAPWSPRPPSPRPWPDAASLTVTTLHQGAAGAALSTPPLVAGSAAAVEHPCPQGLTYDVIRGLSRSGRLERTAPITVLSINVKRPVPPNTQFEVAAVIESSPINYKLKFCVSENASVTGAWCACKDHHNHKELCKHILRVLLEVANLPAPAPPSPAMHGGRLGGAGPNQPGARKTPRGRAYTRPLFGSP